LQKNFPALKISGETHLPAQPIVFLAQSLQMLFWLGLGLGVTGAAQSVPVIGQWLVENKGAGLGMLFFLNVIAGQLMATGAFEVFLDGEMLHSKLETGRLPERRSLLRTLDTKLGYIP